MVEVKFLGVEYVELPMAWSGRSFGLADGDERAYLAARSEVTDETIAVRIVTDDRQIFFVTCMGVTAEGKAG